MIDAGLLLLWVLGFGTMVVTIPWYLALVCLIQRRLRDTKPQLWESLGRPLAPWDMSISVGRRFWRFLKDREYTAMGDEKLIRSCNLCRRLNRIGMSAFAVTVLATFTGFYLNRA